MQFDTISLYIILCVFVFIFISWLGYFTLVLVNMNQVDQHIQQLDQYLKKFSEELQRGTELI